jgi:hypothetical protein
MTVFIVNQSMQICSLVTVTVTNSGTLVLFVDVSYHTVAFLSLQLFGICAVDNPVFCAGRRALDFNGNYVNCSGTQILIDVRAFSETEFHWFHFCAC